jgi:hypothetical protein
VSEREDLFAYYAGQHERQRLFRFRHNRLELLRTRQLLRRQLPSPPAGVLDVGGRPHRRDRGQVGAGAVHRRARPHPRVHRRLSSIPPTSCSWRWQRPDSPTYWCWGVRGRPGPLSTRPGDDADARLDSALRCARLTENFAEIVDVSAHLMALAAAP